MHTALTADPSAGWQIRERAVVRQSCLCPAGLEERIAEDTISFCRPVEIPNSSIELLLFNDSCVDGRLADTLNHSGECPLGETFDEVGSAGVDVDHPWRDMN